MTNQEPGPTVADVLKLHGMLAQDPWYLECKKLELQLKAEREAREKAEKELAQHTGCGESLECGHNSYWRAHYGSCSACRTEAAEKEVENLRSHLDLHCNGKCGLEWAATSDGGKGE